MDSEPTAVPKTTHRPRLTNREVAAIFEEIADMLEVLGENPYKIRAYRNAARTLQDLHASLYEIHRAGTLEELPGIGEAISKKIAELLETGHLSYHQELAAQVPKGVLEMMRVPEVGPKTARRLWQELGITGVEALEQAAREGRIRRLKGFGPKTEEKILRGIQLLAQQTTRMPIGHARPLALELVAALERASGDALARIAIAGSLRRWKETIGDVDLLAISHRPAAVMEAFCHLDYVDEVLAQGTTKSSVVLHNGLQVDLRVVEPRHWGAALCYFTGSKAHNVALRELALEQGWSLNEYGLTARNHPELPDGTQRFFPEEEALYAFLGLDFIPPELREARGEIQAARAHRLPRLIQETDIQGELHGHSTWSSDGKASIPEMAEAARARGHRYWACTDHSAGLGITGGLDGDAVLRQAQEIQALNRRYREQGIDFRILHGIEVEILADGSLGLPDEILARLDVVVASIHTAQRQDPETITERCLQAVRNPHVDILGHPTGRLVGQRPPTAIDLERVLKACAETGTVVEVNASPYRLDLNDIHARRAVELGCMLAISCDAHSPEGLDVLEYGVATARRGWVEPQQVVNTRPVEEMLALLKDRSR